MKIIAIEEHFATEEYVDNIRLILRGNYPIREIVEAEQQLHLEVSWLSDSKYAMQNADILTSKMLDVGEGRLKEMDEAGIEMQVLSLVSPGVQVFDAPTGVAMARRVNNELSRIVQKYPKRFAGLAALAPQDADEAADELERAVKELGLKGASINSHIRGEYLDDKKYWVLFERAEKLGIPIYIHPRTPSPDMLKPYLMYIPLATASIGFAAEVGLHILRLIYGGVFDKYPGLRIILGHLGEALPFWLGRLDARWLKTPPGKKPNKKPSHYVKNNFYVTTSGMFSHSALLCTYLELGGDSILLAADHPFESNKEAIQFIEAAPICDHDKEKVCHLNAARLFALPR